MLELLALFGCVLALGYVLYFLLVIAVAILWIPFVLIWAMAKVVLVVILSPVVFIRAVLFRK